MNGLFGVDAPKLMNLMISELSKEIRYRTDVERRKFYELDQMLPFELGPYNARKAAEKVVVKNVVFWFLKMSYAG